MPIATDTEWLTWPQAAALVGCPVPTIDYHTRTGRIRHRVGQHPSLDAASVKDFATWWHAREARRQELAVTRQRANAATSLVPPTPNPNDWVHTAAAAQMMGCSESHVPWLARHGRIEGQLLGRKWWYRIDSIRAHITERDQWMSEVAAARLIGCDARIIQRAVRDGRLEQRNVHRTQASLALDSVLAFAEQHWAAVHQRRLAHRERERQETERRKQLGPPPDGHAWIGTRDAAIILGVTQERVRALAGRGWYVTELRAGRRWYRQDQVERLARGLGACLTAS